MDAEHLDFPDASFDVGCGAIRHHHSAEPRRPPSTNSPASLKPGGEIVLVSRVGAEAGLRRALERWFAPAARKLGWRTEFSFERYAHWAGRERTACG